jgi:hypothetical protein
MSTDNYFGPGTTPERVAEAVERAQREREGERSKAKVSTRLRDEFFQRMADERKRAEAG